MREEVTAAEARVVLVAHVDALLEAAAADFDRRLRAVNAPERDFAALSAALFCARMECLLLIDRVLAQLEVVH